MPKDVRRHFFEATSVSSDVLKHEPKKASLNFWLSNGECLTVAVPRYVLGRLPAKIDQSLKAAPLIGRGNRPAATSQSK